jgi:tRNA (uracil-5-)-methyltransferase TRM9
MVSVIKDKKIDNNLDLEYVYNHIASDFDRTRTNDVWHSTKLFLDNIDASHIGLDAGCGNGKNMLYRDDLKFCGIDFCDKFVEICKSKKLNVSKCNILDIQFPDNYFDFVISVAVIHHLDTLEKRIKAINEIFRVCKPGGKIFIQVWAFEQPDDSKRKFESNDEYVSWDCRADNVKYFRYYHLYNKNELQEELKKSDYKYDIIKEFYENGNWGISLVKL